MTLKLPGAAVRLRRAAALHVGRNAAIPSTSTTRPMSTWAISCWRAASTAASRSRRSVARPSPTRTSRSSTTSASTIITYFWQRMKKGGGGTKLPGRVQKLVDDLGGYDNAHDFIEAGKTQFGSGWCWLALEDGKLAVMKTPNGDNPLMRSAPRRFSAATFGSTAITSTTATLARSTSKPGLSNLVNWSTSRSWRAKAAPESVLRRRPWGGRRPQAVQAGEEGLDLLRLQHEDRHIRVTRDDALG